MAFSEETTTVLRDLRGDTDDLRKLFEPDVTRWIGAWGMSQAPEVSMAISLRRIADHLSNPVAAVSAAGITDCGKPGLPDDLIRAAEHLHNLIFAQPEGWRRWHDILKAAHALMVEIKRAER